MTIMIIIHFYIYSVRNAVRAIVVCLRSMVDGAMAMVDGAMAMVDGR